MPLRVDRGTVRPVGPAKDRAWLAFAVIVLVVTAGSARAGIDDLFEAVKDSEFRFFRTQSEVPFIPLGWVQDKYYLSTEYHATSGNLPSAEANENTFSEGLAVPAFIAKRDMLLVGEDITWDRINVQSGPYPDKDVLMVTPLVAWLHQFNSNNLAGAFGAPILSTTLNAGGSWGTECYAGIIGLHWSSDKWQWLYGGVYEYSFSRNYGYPYLGVMWLPTPKVSVSLTYPWPTILYVPQNRVLFQIAVAPGGSSWVAEQNEVRTTQSFNVWTLTAGVGYRFYQKLWLVGGAGVAGLRGVQIGNPDEAQLQGNPGAVFTLAIQFRP
jgi:hypothetical protein